MFQETQSQSKIDPKSGQGRGILPPHIRGLEGQGRGVRHQPRGSREDQRRRYHLGAQDLYHRAAALEEPLARGARLVVTGCAVCWRLVRPSPWGSSRAPQAIRLADAFPAEHVSGRPSLTKLAEKLCRSRSRRSARGARDQLEAEMARRAKLWGVAIAASAAVPSRRRSVHDGLLSRPSPVHNLANAPERLIPVETRAWPCASRRSVRQSVTQRMSIAVNQRHAHRPPPHPEFSLLP